MANLSETGRVLACGEAIGLSVARHSHRSVYLRWLAVLLVACGAITVFFPFFWMAVTSLKTAPEIQRVPLQIAPDNWLNLSNYREVFRASAVLALPAEQRLVASMAAVSSLVVSSLAGYGFAKFHFPGRDAFFLAIVGILMVPVPIDRRPALRVGESPRAAGHVPRDRGPGPGQRLRRVPHAAERSR